uniref:Coiled-coil domain-containing protein 148 n=1 Tax=Macrostomum lignano TaxID=282301 RepID=A0A1I8HRE8_9PLAT
MDAAEIQARKRLKPIDYAGLRQQAEAQKRSSAAAEAKANKLAELQSQGKERHLLKQHRLAWKKECLRLRKLRLRHAKEAESFLHSAFPPGSELHSVASELESLDMAMQQDRDIFKEDTVQPYWLLCEDLKFFCQHRGGGGEEGSAGDPREIQSLVADMKAKQSDILATLDRESANLEQELASLAADFGISVGGADDEACCFDELEPGHQTGIPEEAWDLECPSDDLKAEALQEFILLDQRYLERLAELREKFSTTLAKAPFGGWPEAEHRLFELIRDEYLTGPVVFNRHSLCADRLERTFPARTRQQLADHGDWLTAWRAWCERRHVLAASWRRARAELLVKIEATFAQAWQHEEEDIVREGERDKRDALRAVLSEKLRVWRQQKEEEAQLELRAEERRRQELEERERQEAEREERQRQQQRRQLSTYQQEKERLRSEAAAREEARLEQLKRQLREQAERDAQRIGYRREERSKRMEAERMRTEQLAEAGVQREERLEHLRELVRPRVLPDIERATGDTAASKLHQHRRRGQSSADEEADEPLPVHAPGPTATTFTDKQILADPRVRLEGALRQAGLIGNDYAKELLRRQAGPLERYRKDQVSTVFKYEQQQQQQPH